MGAPGQPSASERAYAHVKSGILDGTHTGGQFFTEGEVAEAVGVSRTPVREALLRLEVEGLVRLFPKKGAVVTSFSVREAEDVLEARVLVENFTAARSFANRAGLLPQLMTTHADTKQRRRESDTAGFTE